MLDRKIEQPEIAKIEPVLFSYGLQSLSQCNSTGCNIFINVSHAQMPHRGYLMK